MLKRLLAIYAWVLLAFLLLPVLIIVPASLSHSTTIEFPPRGLTFEWYGRVFAGSDWLNSGMVSTSISAIAALVGVVAGFCLALAQYRLGALPKAVQGIMAIPILVPHIVIGAGLFGMMIALGANFESYLPLALVYGTISIPVVMSVLVPTFMAIDPLIWTAAESLGASPWVATRKVMAPLVAPALVVAFLLAFSVAWDETTLAIFIGPTTEPTLSVRMFGYLQQNVTPEIAALSTIILALTVGIALLTRLFARR